MAGGFGSRDEVEEAVVGLPTATGIAPILTTLAATGLAVVMVLAALTRVRRKESAAIAFNAVLFLLAAFVAWGRSQAEPGRSRRRCAGVGPVLSLTHAQALERQPRQ
ncbi:DoxX family protein [Nonomuraea sp. NPDC050383]|uniref:DoxX family protein n=1 Tax=Nonomuraea sp. NPDC050383 TaxID=3364362 RepID=UPI0037ACB5F4